jgi:hypothetical protein
MSYNFGNQQIELRRSGFYGRGVLKKTDVITGKLEDRSERPSTDSDLVHVFLEDHQDMKSNEH